MQDRWGCFVQDENDPFFIGFAIENELLTANIGALEKAVLFCVAAATWTGTRVAELDSSATSLSNARRELDSQPMTQLRAPQLAYLTAHGFCVSAGSLKLFNDEAIWSHFNTWTQMLLDGRLSHATSSDALPGMPHLNDSLWSSPEFRPLMTRLLTRQSWADNVLGEAAKLGITRKGLDRSVSLTGPVYNSLDHQGIPLPGQFGVRSEEAHGGLSRLAGIELNEGRISIFGKRASPAEFTTIWPDDVKVATALAYGSASGPTPPSFSLDFVDSKTNGERCNSILQAKEFDPPWLGNTQFGRTLFWSDYLLQQIVGMEGLPLQSVTRFDLSMESHLAKGPEAIEWLSQLKTPTAQHIPAGTLGARFCIKLAAVNVQKSPDSRRITLSGGTCYLESAYHKATSNGQVDSNAYLNDPNTEAGSVAVSVNSSWPKLRQLYPVFSRVEQILILYKLLEYSRTAGWRLAREEMSRLSTFIHLLGTPKKGDLFVPLPYHKAGCQCSGKWPQPAIIRSHDLWA